MIICFSASSPIASVALISEQGEILFEDQRETHQNASGACMEMLEEGLRVSGKELRECTLFCADIGPGSFIGSRVGVTLAKSFAFACGVQAAGATSFDLIDQHQTVILPSKKGEFFVRPVGEEAFRTGEIPNKPYTGYGPGIENQVVPQASRIASLLRQLDPVEPEFLLPKYLIEPSISTPKKPYKPLSP